MRIFMFFLICFSLTAAHSQSLSERLLQQQLQQQQESAALNNKKYEEGKCTESYGEYKKTFSEARDSAIKESKELHSEIAKLEKEKIKDEGVHLEAIENARKAAKDAEVDFEKAKAEITEALNTLEEQTNTQATEMVRALQDDINKLEENLTTERDTVNNEYENAKNQGYEQCKAQAEQLYISKMGLNQKINQSKNMGLKKTGGASFASGSEIKKIKAEAIRFHTKCVAEVTRTLDASRATNIKKLDSAKKRIEQEINTKRVELDRLTNGQYTKKVGALHEKLRVAGVELQNAQTKAQQEVQRLENQAMREKIAADNEITFKKLEQESKRNFNAAESSEIQDARSTAHAACCQEKRDKDGDLIKDSEGNSIIEPKFGGIVSQNFCSPEKKKRSSRRSQTEGSR